MPPQTFSKEKQRALENAADRMYIDVDFLSSEDEPRIDLKQHPKTARFGQPFF